MKFLGKIWINKTNNFGYNLITIKMKGKRDVV